MILLSFLKVLQDLQSGDFQPDKGFIPVVELRLENSTVAQILKLGYE